MSFVAIKMGRRPVTPSMPLIPWPPWWTTILTSWRAILIA